MITKEIISFKKKLFLKAISILNDKWALRLTSPYSYSKKQIEREILKELLSKMDLKFESESLSLSKSWESIYWRKQECGRIITPQGDSSQS
jgi:hypothetical protein